MKGGLKVEDIKPSEQEVVAKFAEVVSTGQLITICDKMAVLFTLTPYKLKTPVMFSEKDNGAKYRCQKVVE